MKKIATYTIQDWLFSIANGRFDIDLAESGIQPHRIQDLSFTENYDLNYSVDIGQEQLRQCIADMYQVDLARVMIANGSQEALYLFYRSFLSSADHVITFTPGWQQSWEVPNYIGCAVTKIPLTRETGYKIDMAQIIDSLRPNTKLIVLTSPNNPLGITCHPVDLEKLYELCCEKGIFLLNDEEYLTDYTQSIVQFGRLTGAVSSLSKIYGYPGLRVGWFIGTPSLIQDMVNYKRYTTVTNSSLCEFLALEVLKNRKQYVSNYQAMSAQGESLLREFVARWPECDMISPQGTPFAYITLPKTWNSAQFCQQLLAQHHVLIMPAEVFEDKHALRISFGRPQDLLRKGLEKLDEFINFYRVQYAN
ncbi:TPA: pyridoxal phosphate-dependent aminotransferase [Legionella pneumophila]|nr:pyridoxal phosphate-dependent aminotransferase [Legionella pneumophila]HAU1644209.1 pyridoxal phosphate-dependent aminotransferase [Legionella pneumophila]